MALFRQLLTARQSVIIDDIETLQSQISSKEDDITALQGRLDSEVAKINALQSLTTSHTSQLNTNNDTLALKLQIENEKIKTVALQSLTESHTSQITSHDGDITALQGRLDIEEQNIIDLDDLTANHIDDIDALQTLTASHTTDIASNTADILTKQDLITSSSYLNCNSLTTNHLEVDNIISTSQFFDTIVVRRPTGVSGVGSDRIGVKELQCWVNGVNIMINNGLTSYFANWLNKEADIGSQNASTTSTLAYNNSIDDLGALSSSSENLNATLIIKNIPYTPIHNIQAIVFYSRDTNDTLQTAVGVGIELYNSTNDPTYTTPLASTPVITETVVLIYRYDFPSIDTYTDFVGVNSITNIVNNTFAFAQEAEIISYTEITGDVVVAGDLTAENLIVGSTNVITEINTKQDFILDGDLTIAKTDGLLTALNSTAKLDSANTFTGLQTVNGDLKADHVLVKITAPTLNTHLTSKLYVDTAISNVNVDTTNLSKLDQANTFTETNTFTDITTTSLINNNKNIDDRDHFHYAGSYGTISKNVNQAINFNLTKRGSTLVSGESFIPKYTGLYSISCSIFLGAGSTGELRIGININGTNYNLNGDETYLVCATTNENADGNMLNGNIIVDATAGQTIRLNVRVGTIKYLSKYSYFHGYYIGAS